MARTGHMYAVPKCRDRDRWRSGWGQAGSSDGSAGWGDFPGAGRGKKVRSQCLGEGKAGLRFPGFPRRGLVGTEAWGCEALSTWRPHRAVCCRGEEARLCVCTK